MHEWALIISIRENSCPFVAKEKNTMNTRIGINKKQSWKFGAIRGKRKNKATNARMGTNKNIREIRVHSWQLLAKNIYRFVLFWKRLGLLNFLLPPWPPDGAVL